MYSFNSFSNIGSDHLSVEVNSDDFFFSPEPYNSLADVNMNDLFNLNIIPSEDNISGFCQSDDLLDSLINPTERNELNKYLGPTVPSDSTPEIDDNLLVYSELPVCGAVKNKKIKPNKKPILLSSSVGIGQPQRPPKQTRQIEIACDLELTYRPRYKSDYFAQNGKTRRPRYVADRHGNHYVTLKLPPNAQGRIRVDWLTIPTADGTQYHMPYRFQADNDSAATEDCNPIYYDVAADSLGIMKLYLVLIKAKQDALKTLQPLQPFQPWKDALGYADTKKPEKTIKYTPKKLIQTFQLGKSQLAFTLCGTDGQSNIPIWDSTAYSTVMEEESSDNSTEKNVACPNCSHEISVNDEGIIIDETKNKRKSSEGKIEKPKTIKKQRSFPEEIYCFT